MFPLLNHLSNLFYVQEVPPDVLVNVFFLYSFLGWGMECVVIRHEKGAWENRGFVRLPFCVIYGFGAMIGYALLRPLEHHAVLLYVAGAAGATVFEYLTGCLMQKLFGEFWWDYSNKRFNYKGMICLESTVAWGAIGLFIFHFLHGFVFRVVLLIPRPISRALAGLLLLAYAVDFLASFRRAFLAVHGEDEAREPVWSRWKWRWK